MAKKTSAPRSTPPRSDGAPARKPRARRAVPSENAAPLEPTQLEIAERAYYLYVERGGVPDREFDDWVRAERELREARTGRP